MIPVLNMLVLVLALISGLSLIVRLGREGVLRRYCHEGGRQVDVVSFSIVRADWES